MTADVYPFPIKDLLEISTRITNTARNRGWVTYDGKFGAWRPLKSVVIYSLAEIYIANSFILGYT
jgi:hypothetical protein